MTHAHAFRLSVNPLSHLSSLARLRSLARPAGQGLLLAALLTWRNEGDRPVRSSWLRLTPSGRLTHTGVSRET